MGTSEIVICWGEGHWVQGCGEQDLTVTKQPLWLCPEGKGGFSGVTGPSPVVRSLWLGYTGPPRCNPCWKNTDKSKPRYGRVKKRSSWHGLSVNNIKDDKDRCLTPEEARQVQLWTPLLMRADPGLRNSWRTGWAPNRDGQWAALSYWMTWVGEWCNGDVENVPILRIWEWSVRVPATSKHSTARSHCSGVCVDV